jgi:hypothetical protein
MLCDFKVTPLDDGRFLHECQRSTCPNKFTLGVAQLTAQCKGVPEGQRLFNFTRAMIAHVFHGCPTCSDEEITARHTICQACPLYVPASATVGYCSHASCGCPLNRLGRFVSKLGWRDQHCPIGRW